MILFASTFAVAHLQAEQVDPAVLIGIVIVVIIIIAAMSGGGSTTQPGGTAAADAPTAPISARQQIDSALALLGTMSEQQRFETLQSLFPQLPSPLPADCVPALLQGTSHQVRLRAIRLLHPKLEIPVPVQLQTQIAGGPLMNNQERAEAVYLLTH